MFKCSRSCSSECSRSCSCSLACYHLPQDRLPHFLLPATSLLTKYDTLPHVRDYAKAFTLALRAHCQRGDSARALGVLEALRDRGRSLPPEAYLQVAGLF